MEHLVLMPHSSWCKWKGRAAYYKVVVGDKQVQNAAWFYPTPPACFYQRLRLLPASNGCYVNDEQVQPQPGDFYGGSPVILLGHSRVVPHLGLVTSPMPNPVLAWASFPGSSFLLLNRLSHHAQQTFDRMSCGCPSSQN